MRPRSSAVVRIFVASCVAVLSLVLSGCGDQKAQFQNIDITGANYARDFTLRDTSGAVRHLADYKGKVVVLFFGYTQCPDVCPTTLTDLARAMKELGPDASRVQVLFVTVDPARDTPAVLKAYVPNFDPSFQGLYGNAAETTAVTQEFKVFYQKVDGPTPQSYSIDHSVDTYVFDPEGRVRLFIKAQATPESVAHDIKLLLTS